MIDIITTLKMLLLAIVKIQNVLKEMNFVWLNVVVVLNVQQQNFVHLDVIVMIVEIQNAIVATVVFCVKKKKKEEMHVVHNVKMFVQIVFLCVPVLMLVRSVKLFSAVGRGVLVLSAMSVRFIVIHFATVAINVKTAMVVELMKIIFVLLVGNNLYLKILSQVQTITRKEIFYI